MMFCSTGEVGVTFFSARFPRYWRKAWSETHGAEETPREFIDWKDRQPNVKALVHVTRIIQLLLNGVSRREFVSAGR
jgi:hypothetical protein